MPIRTDHWKIASTNTVRDRACQGGPQEAAITCSQQAAESGAAIAQLRRHKTLRRASASLRRRALGGKAPDQYLGLSDTVPPAPPQTVPEQADQRAGADEREQSDAVALKKIAGMLANHSTHDHPHRRVDQGARDVVQHEACVRDVAAA